MNTHHGITLSQSPKKGYMLVHIIHITTATLLSQGSINVLIFIEKQYIMYVCINVIQ